MVELTKAAIEALEAGTRWEMEGAIEDRHLLQRKKVVERSGVVSVQADRDRGQRVLLACADVLAALHYATVGFRVQDDLSYPIPDEQRPETVEVDFTPEATGWLAELRASVAGHLEEMEMTSSEGDLDHVREQAFLLRTLDRVVGGREAVAA